MGTWASLATDLLWRHALAAIPLGLFVTIIARLLPCRPATRHTLWLVLLLWLIAAPFLPQAPSISAGLLGLSDSGLKNAAQPPRTGNPQATIRVPRSATALAHPARQGSASRMPHSPARSEAVDDRLTTSGPPTVSDPGGNLSFPSTGRSGSASRRASGMPERFVQATAPVGSLDPFDDNRRQSTKGMDRETHRHLRSNPASLADRHAADRSDLSASSLAHADAIAPGQRQLESQSSTLAPRRRDADPFLGSRQIAGKERDARPLGKLDAWREWLVALVAVRDAVGDLPPLPANIWIIGAVAVLLCVCVLLF